MKTVEQYKELVNELREDLKEINRENFDLQEELQDCEDSLEETNDLVDELNQENEKLLEQAEAFNQVEQETIGKILDQGESLKEYEKILNENSLTIDELVEYINFLWARNNELEKRLAAYQVTEMALVEQKCKPRTETFSETKARVEKYESSCENSSKN
jgi:chromosome segregation ATPase